MTRKDYEVVARVIRAARQQEDPFTFMVDRLADAFAAGNPRFDRGRFARAADNKGVE